MDVLPFCISAIRTESDREMMQNLYTANKDMMYRIALRITRNRADAEDAVGAACVSLIRSIERVRSVHPRAHRAYLASTVRNQALMLVKKRETEQRYFEHYADESELEKVCKQPVEDQELFYRRTLMQVMKALWLLSERDQHILRMRFFDKLSYPEIAAVLDLSIMTTRQRLCRARRNLHKALKEIEEDDA